MNSSRFMRKSLVNAGLALTLLFVLAACGGGGGGSSAPPAPTTNTVGGAVTGLKGTGLVIRNDGKDLAVTKDGAFTFPAQTKGTAYNVTIVTQPASPTQTCTVANGSGTLNADVTNVAVDCKTILTVASSTPIEGASNASRANDLVVNFSAALDASTATADNVKLTGPAAAVIAITPAADGTRLTIASNAPLDRNTQYTLTITTGLRGTSGEVLAAPVVIHFTTEDAVLTLAMTSSTVTDGALDVSRSDNMVFSFSLPLDATTVNPAPQTSDVETVLLKSQAGHLVPMSASLSGRQVTLVLKEALQRQTPYNLTFLSDIASVGGEVLNSNIVIHFTTTDRGWQTPTPFVAAAAGARDMRLIGDDQGNGLALWMQPDGAVVRLWSRKYTAANGWETPIEIGPGRNVPLMRDLRLAGNAAGDAMAVWAERRNPGDLNSRLNVWSSRYTPSGNTAGWSAPTPIQSDAGLDPLIDARTPELAIDSSGTVIAIWRQQQDQFPTPDDFRSVVWASRNSKADAAWNSTAPIGQLSNSLRGMSIAINDQDAALAAWSEGSGGLRAARFSPAAAPAWSNPERLARNGNCS